MNVVMILTNRFDPDVRVLKEAKYLSDRGHSLEILCWDREKEYIDRNIEYIDKIKIVRFFPYSKYGTGLKQIIPFIKFIKECRNYLKNKQVDVLHMHDLDGSIVGLFSRSRNCKLVFDMHEIYELQNNNLILKKVISLIVKFIQTKVDYIIYLNAYQIKSINNKNIDKLVYLPNYPDINNFINTTKTSSKKLRISYIGMVGNYEIFKNLFEACKKNDNVEISIHGYGIAYERLKNIEKNYKNVKVTGKYNFLESCTLYNNSDILYAVYNMDNKQNVVSEPIKYFEAIVTGTPIIVNKGMFLENEIIDKNIGFVVDGYNIEEIREFIKFIIQNNHILEEYKSNLKILKNKYVWQEVIKNIDLIY